MARIEHDQQSLRTTGDDATAAETPATTDRPSRTRSGGNGFSIAAMISGVLAVIAAPIIFGPLAIILAFVARNRLEPRARTAMTVAVTGTVVGFVLAFVLAATLTT